jgi:hypothetical protein
LNSLPDAPATNILDFRGGEILDFVPFEYGNTDLSTQIVDVKHFTEEDISSVSANVRRSKWANDGNTFGYQSKINEVSLGTSNVKAEGSGGRRNPQKSLRRWLHSRQS